MAENKENKGVDPGREFSQGVDRMLAGQEPHVPTTLGNDYRTAVDFARSLIQHRVKVRSSFKAQLKERLLSRLDEEERNMKTITELRRNRFWEPLGSVVPRQPVWQALTAMLLLVVIAGGVMWGSGVFTQTATPTPPSGIALTPRPGPARPPLEMSASPAKTGHLPGETITIEFTFRNSGTGPITLRPFPPEIRVMQPWPHEAARAFGAGSGERALQPGETATHALAWDQLDAGGRQVVPGYYFVDVNDIYIEGTEVGTMRISSGTIARVLIQFPQGAMEKRIAVNESRTAKGITITLERVELSATGARVYAFTTPAGYRLQEGGPALPAPNMMVNASARYGVDRGLMKDTGPSGSRFLANGIELVWDQLDPIPSDARVLTFTITKLGEWLGTWEFEVPLQ